MRAEGQDDHRERRGHSDRAEIRWLRAENGHREHIERKENGKADHDGREERQGKVHAKTPGREGARAKKNDPQIEQMKAGWEICEFLERAKSFFVWSS